ncbi:uncharacterized protein SPPG_00165 [Spizellomyces punctatus DAOM BR117]|uniref:Uncharacterized protein n=1 Tax=Spizellomyces punctatus (strain DAOM BR117) TaxID=645134 RepID=A0A0L0HSU8_SPIPD|nr:uncharacterized protein SPPG_00165 [Spizellomyces punctatus DAOM BR117]KND04436.1 hypothetical protein SPPG_00165 [Spizellomyces punctatus DAOM BR117]|eukprot:XP_016612475.1 hypothetical protein SPPG_00165 [Spizellomyces punctatus DAOM BR117]
MLEETRISITDLSDYDAREIYLDALTPETQERVVLSLGMTPIREIPLERLAHVLQLIVTLQAPQCRNKLKGIRQEDFGDFCMFHRTFEETRLSLTGISDYHAREIYRDALTLETYILAILSLENAHTYQLDLETLQSLVLELVRDPQEFDAMSKLARGQYGKGRSFKAKKHKQLRTEGRNMSLGGLVLEAGPL